MTSQHVPESSYAQEWCADDAGVLLPAPFLTEHGEIPTATIRAFATCEHVPDLFVRVEFRRIVRQWLQGALACLARCSETVRTDREQG